MPKQPVNPEYPFEGIEQWAEFVGGPWDGDMMRLDRPIGAAGMAPRFWVSSKAGFEGGYFFGGWKDENLGVARFNWTAPATRSQLD